MSLHSEESEKSVLGAIISDAQIVMPYCTKASLSEEVFYTPLCRTLYQHIMRLHSANQPIDIITLTNSLRSTNDLDQLGGATQLHRLMDAVTTIAHTPHHIKIIQEKAALRKIVAFAMQIEEDASSGQYTDESLIRRISMAVAKTKAAQTKHSGLTALDIGDLINSEPPPQDFILSNCFESGDKIIVIGASKRKKSFFVQQLAFCLASGLPFLGWATPRPRKVLIVQYEVKDSHFHRRARFVASGLQIDANTLAGRCQVIHGRGRSLSLDAIESLIIAEKYEVVIFDPLYKLITGDENKAQDMKPILEIFDRIATNSNAAVIYVHHDAKGNPGDRETRDRGAGSNVLIRDIDHGFMLSAHESDPFSNVIEILGRNNPDEAKFTATWSNGIFSRNDDIEPNSKSRTGRPVNDQARSRVIELHESDPTLSYGQMGIRLGIPKPTVGRIMKEYLGESPTGYQTSPI